MFGKERPLMYDNHCGCVASLPLPSVGSVKIERTCVCVCVWSVQAIGGEEKKTMVSVNLVPYTY